LDSPAAASVSVALGAALLIAATALCSPELMTSERLGLRGGDGDASEEPPEVTNSSTLEARVPTVAFLILGYNNSIYPLWVTPADKVLIYVPPPTCFGCPPSVKCNPKASGPYVDAPEAWWCAQRMYLLGVQELLEKFPDVEYYFFADVDTVVFRESLTTLIQLLEYEVLKEGEDLYAGQGLTLDHAGDPTLGKFIMSGGGLVVRGLTLQKLLKNGTLDKCIEAMRGPWCYHHADWVLGECLATVRVQPTGHKAFHQYDCDDYTSETMVACHPVKRRTVQRRMLQNRSETNSRTPWRRRPRLGKSWARPCRKYDWRKKACIDDAEDKGEAQKRPVPSVAFMLWAHGEASLPSWASNDMHVLLSLQPGPLAQTADQAAQAVFSGGAQGEASGGDVVAEVQQRSWCKHRERFLGALKRLVQDFWQVDFYFLSSDTTEVFPEAFETLMQLLSQKVLGPAEDLYMGHVVIDPEQDMPNAYVALHEGILLRGHTLRQLATEEGLSKCAEDHESGQWCSLSVDQILARCLAQGMPPVRPVRPSGHPAFLHGHCAAGGGRNAGEAASEASSAAGPPDGRRGRGEMRRSRRPGGGRVGRGAACSLREGCHLAGRGLGRGRGLAPHEAPREPREPRGSVAPRPR